MATLSKIKGRYLLQGSRSRHGAKRWTISIGRMAERQARTVKSHVEELVNAQASHTTIPHETASWLRGISDRLYSKLVRLKMVQPRETSPTIHLGPYFTNYIAKRTDLKPRTKDNLTQVKNLAVKHFGKREMSSITRGEVKDWHRWLSSKLAPATVAMHVKKMRQLYTDAMDRGILTENPFRAVKAGSQVNNDRQRYISKFVIESVIDVATCPDEEWRLLFALARYAGLRVPSETRLLRLADIDLNKMRMTVRSPKTEHHAGKAQRIVPIVPELRPYLAAAKEFSVDGQTYVLKRLRGANPSTTAKKIIERAGVTPWPKVWQNLRSSCETDFAAQFPIHVACAWIGNSTAVAIKSYLQVNDAQFEAATKSAAPSAAVSAGQDRTSDEHGKQNRPYLPSDLRFRLPPRGVSLDPVLARNLHKLHGALHKALHSGNRRLVADRRRIIRNLTTKLKQAKRRSFALGGRRAM